MQNLFNSSNEGWWDCTKEIMNLLKEEWFSNTKANSKNIENFGKVIDITNKNNDPKKMLSLLKKTQKKLNFPMLRSAREEVGTEWINKILADNYGLFSAMLHFNPITTVAKTVEGTHRAIKSLFKPSELTNEKPDRKKSMIKNSYIWAIKHVPTFLAFSILLDSKNEDCDMQQKAYDNIVDIVGKYWDRLDLLLFAWPEAKGLIAPIQKLLSGGIENLWKALKKINPKLNINTKGKKEVAPPSATP